MSSDSHRSKVGILTTYNQACGLATYASYLIQHFDPNDIVVLAEDVDPGDILEPDADNVVRCWKRQAKDHAGLEQALNDRNIGLLHLNCHYRFFDSLSFTQLLTRIRSRGVRAIAHIHNPFTVDQNLRALVQSVDSVVVHTPENRLEVIANGARSDAVEVLEHGVKCLDVQSASAARERLGIPPDSKAVVCFGFVQPHKGIDEVMHAVQALSQGHKNLALYIVGGVHEEDPSSADYMRVLRSVAENPQLKNIVHFSEGFVSDQKVDDYLLAADAVVMNYRSQYFEASGAVCRALGAGAPIIASTAPPFARLGDAVFHITTGFPLPIALEQVLFNSALNSSLRERALDWSDRYSWSNTARNVIELYRRVSGGRVSVSYRAAAPVDESAAGEEKGFAPVVLHPRRGIRRVLMQNRPNALSQRGGDTVVMEEIAAGLREGSVEVDIDVEHQKDPRNYDLVHLFNFATPEITEALARRCHSANVPYVVTTMYEDLPLFYTQMMVQFRAIEAYCRAGQPIDRWPDFIAAVKEAKPSCRWENAWTAEMSAALIASGERERQALVRDYPSAPYVDTYRLGCEICSYVDDGSLFRRETGLKDFVLCVGRLETRKNQLMILKALEESEVTVVFATGGFTYQPDYEKVCREFKRKGETVFIGRLSAELLASAYAAAQVHALPSWYELPGIVSMEAARRGTNVVVSDLGTAGDYFGDSAYYCSPDDADGVYNAIMAGYYAPARKGLVESIEDCTWSNAAKRVYDIYEKALDQIHSRRSSYELPEWKMSTKADQIAYSIETASDAAHQASDAISQMSSVLSTGQTEAAPDPEADRVCEEADALLKQEAFAEALTKYQSVLEQNPSHQRALRGPGIVALRQERYSDAAECFTRVLEQTPNDSKALTGLGAAYWGMGRQDEAFNLYLRALQANPEDLASLLHLVDASYALARFGELEARLRAYLQRNEGNFDIQFCLAGCLYKQGKLDECRAVLEKLLEANPEYADALELRKLVDQAGTEASAEAPPAGLRLVPAESDAAPAAAGPAAPGVLNLTEVDAQLAELENLKHMQDYEAVRARAEEVLQGSGASGDQQAHAQVLKAESLACLNEVPAAQELFERAKASPAWKHRALAGLGAIQASQGNWDAALSSFQESISLRPQYDVAIAGLGICAEQQGDLDAAWNHYRTALAENSENMRALLGIVKLGYPLNRHEEILQATGKYLEIHPANLSILYAHAGCLYAMERFQEAKEQLDRIRIFDPEHELARELQEQIDLKLGQKARV